MDTKFKKGHKINVGRKCSEETKKKIGEANKFSKKAIGWKHTNQSKEKIRISKLGEKNHQWVAKNPSYNSVHIWLNRNFIKTKCEHCGGNKFLEWALKTGLQHDHIKDNYKILCSSCHKKYDYTLERKLKLSNSLKKVVRRKDWYQKISKKLKGKKLSESTKKKMSDYAKRHPRKRDPQTGKFI